MDINQIISLVAIVVLTAVATLIGLQLVYLIKEIRSIVHKLNSTIAQAESSFQKISQPVGNLVNVVDGIRQSGKLIETIGNLIGKNRYEQP